MAITQHWLRDSPIVALPQKRIPFSMHIFWAMSAHRGIFAETHGGYAVLRLGNTAWNEIVDAGRALPRNSRPALQSRRTAGPFPRLCPGRARRQGRHQLNRMDGASEGPLASIDQNGCEPFSTTIACVIVVLVFALDVSGQPAGNLTCKGTLHRLEQIELKFGYWFR